MAERLVAALIQSGGKQCEEKSKCKSEERKKKSHPRGAVKSSKSGSSENPGITP